MALIARSARTKVEQLFQCDTHIPLIGANSFEKTPQNRVFATGTAIAYL